MEYDENTAMVALYLSAAFDSVNHKILIKVLENYFGIQEKHQIGQCHILKIGNSKFTSMEHPQKK